MSRFRRRRRGGFTLIEVLVAITILSTALVILLQNVSNSIYLSEVSRDMTVAAMIAQDKMTELELINVYTIGRQEGDFAERYPGFWWNAQLSESMFPDILQLDLQVFWGNPDNPEYLMLTSFVEENEPEEGEDSDWVMDGDDDDDDDTGSSGDDDTDGGAREAEE